MESYNPGRISRERISRLLFRERPAEDLVAVGWQTEDPDGPHDHGGRLIAQGKGLTL